MRAKLRAAGKKVASAINGRDVHLYGGLLTLGAGASLWLGAGVGLSAGGLVLLLIGLFGIPDLNRKEKRDGTE